MDIDPVEDLQYAIEWYRDVVPPLATAKGPFSPSKRQVEATLDEFRTLLAPNTLSPDLEWFWRTWNVQAMEGLFDLLAGPSLLPPDFALKLWKTNASLGEIQNPWNFVPVAYQSHWFHLADVCAGGTDRPAPLWDYGYGDMNYVLRYPSIAAMFRTAAELIELRGTPIPTSQPDRMGSSPADNTALFAATAERHLVTAGLASAPRRIDADDHLSWPDAWKLATGIGPSETAIHGATHTVEEFVSAARTGAVTARIHGHCREIMGGGIGPGGTSLSIMLISDATGSMGLVLPEGVLQIGSGRDPAFEVEVRSTEPVGDIPSSEFHHRINDAALRGDHEAAEAEFPEFLAAAAEAAAHLPRISRIVAID